MPSHLLTYLHYAANIKANMKMELREWEEVHTKYS